MTFSTAGNNGWLFQKAYYNDFNWNQKEDEQYATDFFKNVLTWLRNTRHVANTGFEEGSSIRLTTIYPGLATGVGVMHESKSKGELKLGFEFDYISGMPVIRGHSVKGALRAAFPQSHNNNIKYKKEKAYQLSCWLENNAVTAEGFELFKQDNESYKKIIAVEEEVFDGKKDDRLLSSYMQDVFFDAFIAQPSSYETSINKYLDADSITPHGDNPLKNPIPIPFLKVLPGVTFEFRFSLHDNGIISPEQKKNLFKNILLENGIGAKTNVGYGQFIDEINKSRNEHTAARNATIPAEKDEIPVELKKYLKKNKVFNGEISNMTDTFIVSTFTIEGHKMKIVRRKDKTKGEPAIGKKSILTVNGDYNVNDVLNCKIVVSE